MPGATEPNSSGPVASILSVPGVRPASRAGQAKSVFSLLTACCPSLTVSLTVRSATVSENTCVGSRSSEVVPSPKSQWKVRRSRSGSALPRALNWTGIPRTGGDVTRTRSLRRLRRAPAGAERRPARRTRASAVSRDMRPGGYGIGHPPGNRIPANSRYLHSPDSMASATSFGKDPVCSSLWLNGVSAGRPLDWRRKACTRSSSPAATYRTLGVHVPLGQSVSEAQAKPALGPPLQRETASIRTGVVDTSSLVLFGWGARHGPPSGGLRLHLSG